jgi:hypothetical protein
MSSATGLCGSAVYDGYVQHQASFLHLGRVKLSYKKFRQPMLLQGNPIGGTAFDLGGLNARRLREPVYWFADQYLQVSASL